MPESLDSQTIIGSLIIPMVQAETRSNPTLIRRPQPRTLLIPSKFEETENKPVRPSRREEKNREDNEQEYYNFIPRLPKLKNIIINTQGMPVTQTEVKEARDNFVMELDAYKP